MTIVPPKQAGGRHAPEPIPMDIPRVDELRIRLREIAAKMQGNPNVELATIPGVQSLAIAVRSLPGGRMQFIEFVQFAMLNQLPAAHRFWLVLADLTVDQRMKVSFDDVCAASGVRPSQLLMEVMGCAMEFGHDVGNLVAAAAQVALVRQTTKSAMRIGGDWAKVAQRDREMLFEHHGFIPVGNRGATVNVNTNASASAQAAAALSSDPSVPSFSSTMRGLQHVREITQQQLADAPVTINVSRVAVTVPGD